MKPEESPDRPDEWLMEGEMAYRGAEWIGALFFYIIRRNRQSVFEYFLHLSYCTKNVIVGTIIQLITLGVILYLIYLFL